MEKVKTEKMDIAKMTLDFITNVAKEYFPGFNEDNIVNYSKFFYQNLSENIRIGTYGSYGKYFSYVIDKCKPDTIIIFNVDGTILFTIEVTINTADDSERYGEGETEEFNVYIKINDGTELHLFNQVKNYESHSDFFTDWYVYDNEFSGEALIIRSEDVKRWLNVEFSLMQLNNR